MKRLKKSIAFLLAMVMVCQPAVTVYAEDLQPIEKVQEAGSAVIKITEEETTETAEKTVETEASVVTEEPQKAEGETAESEGETAESNETKGSENQIDNSRLGDLWQEFSDAVEQAQEEQSVQDAKEILSKEGFEQSREADGVIVTVKAEAGVFPEGAELSVRKVTEEVELQAVSEAIEEARKEEKNVAASYTFDIKVMKDGEEIQPDTEKGKVEVSFKMAEKADGNSEAEVYHVTEAAIVSGEDTEETAQETGAEQKENKQEESLDTSESEKEPKLVAEELKIEETPIAEEKKGEESAQKTECLTETGASQAEEETVLIVEAMSFSYYTVEFTYDKKQYVLDGDSEVKLSVIQEKVGLTGTVTEAVSSNSELFSAVRDTEGDDWTVTALQEFSSVEKLTLTISGFEYEVKVTDAQVTLFKPGNTWIPEGIDISKVEAIFFESDPYPGGEFLGTIDTAGVVKLYYSEYRHRVDINIPTGYGLFLNADCSGMFEGFTSLYKLAGFPESYDTVTDCSKMFYGCQISSIELFMKTTEATNAEDMFVGSEESLQRIELGEEFSSAFALPDKKYYNGFSEEGRSGYKNTEIPKEHGIYVADMSQYAAVKYVCDTDIGFRLVDHTERKTYVTVEGFCEGNIIYEDAETKEEYYQGQLIFSEQDGTNRLAWRTLVAADRTFSPEYSIDAIPVQDRYGYGTEKPSLYGKLRITNTDILMDPQVCGSCSYSCDDESASDRTHTVVFYDLNGTEKARQTYTEKSFPETFYKVTFDTNGVEVADKPGCVYIASGNAFCYSAYPDISILNYTAAGKTFVGWFKDKACLIPWDEAADTVTSDITLYAKWRDDSFCWIEQEDGGYKYRDTNGVYLKNCWVSHGDSYSYLGADGYMATDSIIETYGNRYYVDEEGYRVIGQWVIFDETDEQIKKDYPQYKMYFKTYSGKGYVGGISTINGKKYCFDKDGKSLYGFVGGSFDSYNHCSPLESAWYFGDSLENNSAYTGWLDVRQSVEDPEYSGYETVRLYFKNGVKKYGVTISIDGKKYSFDANGVCRPDCTVTFNTKGKGVTPDPKIIVYGSYCSLPEEPTAEGWRFEGWYEDAGCSIKWDNYSNPVTANKTVYAKWTENNEGTWVTDQGKTRFLNIDQTYAKKAWRNRGTGISYLDEDGFLAQNRLIIEDESSVGIIRGIYYVDSQGYRVQNMWVQQAGSSESCRMYFGKNGRAYTQKRAVIDGKTYLFDEEGKCIDGFCGIDEQVIEEENAPLYAERYFSPETGLYSGWLDVRSFVTDAKYTDMDHVWMYFDQASGGFKKKDGIFEIDGTYYAFDSSGVTARNGGCTVTFDFNGENANSIEAVNGVLSGEIIEQVENPTSTRYIFDGWYTDPACTQKFYNEVNNSITLYAKWSPKGQWISYEGEHYYRLGNGKKLTNQWIKTNMNFGQEDGETQYWYYLDSAGIRQMAGVSKVKGRYYLFDSNRHVVSGLVYGTTTDHTLPTDFTYQNRFRYLNEYQTMGTDVVKMYFYGNCGGPASLRTGGQHVTIDGEDIDIRFDKHGYALEGLYQTKIYQNGILQKAGDSLFTVKQLRQDAGILPAGYYLLDWVGNIQKNKAAVDADGIYWVAKDYRQNYKIADMEYADRAAAAVLNATVEDIEDEKVYFAAEDTAYKIVIDATRSEKYVYVGYEKAGTSFKVVTFIDGDGNVLEKEVYKVGETPVYAGKTPTKTAIAKYTYTWNGGWDKTVTTVTESTTYIAAFNSAVNKYEITWKDGDGNILKKDMVEYDQLPSYSGTTPTKTATAKYTYTWNGGWDKAVAAVTGAATYTAAFNSTVNKYTVTWKNYDGTVLKTDSVAYGTTPVYNGATPEKASTAEYTYTFTGWSPSVAAVTGDATYTAQFGSKQIIQEGFAVESGAVKYYKDGKFQSGTSGFVEFSGGSFFVANGILQQASGLLQDPQKPADWYFCANGETQKQYTGLAQYDGAWFYVNSGKLNTTLGGFVDYNGGKFFLAAGEIKRNVNGLCQDPQNPLVWYFLANGEVQNQYTGLCQYNGAWFYVIAGRFATEFTGRVEYNGSWFNVVNGEVK